MRRFRLALAVVLAFLVVAGFVLAHPQWLFPYSAKAGRLSLYSDRPFSAAGAQRALADIESRLVTSPLDDHKPHAIFVTNTGWRRALFFRTAPGAAGVNFYPLTNNVFIRAADIDRGQVFGVSGRPAAAPRTFAYYAAHEIGHSFTGEHLGMMHVWNARLPQWVREGYADYVGMGGEAHLDALYQRYRAGDPDLNFNKSHTYAKFRLLVAFMIQRQGWSIDQLLASHLTEAQAEARMNTVMATAAKPL